MPVELLAHPLAVALIAGAMTGLITWGGLRVEVRYLRRDVDKHQYILDNLPCRQGRRATDHCKGH